MKAQISTTFFCAGTASGFGEGPAELAFLSLERHRVPFHRLPGFPLQSSICRPAWLWWFSDFLFCPYLF